MSPSGVDRALEAIDRLHADDPVCVEVDGRSVPRELLYARRMSAALARLEASPSAALRLAVRAQHLCRWRIPRDAYPRTRAGYHRWRTELGALHGRLARDAVLDAGLDAATAERVEGLVRKRRLKSDPEAQHLEDAACLVFLEHELEAFAQSHERTQVLGILRKTWVKMGDAGRREALRLPLSPTSRALVEEALRKQEGSGSAPRT